MTRMAAPIMEKLFELARKAPKRVVFPETGEDRVLQAARKALDMGIVHPILLGDPDAIGARAKELGLSLDGIAVVRHPDEAAALRYAEAYAARKSDYSLAALQRRMKDPLNMAVIMVEIGEADCCMAGVSHTTGEVVLAGQMFLGTKPGIATVSSIGIMDIPGWQGSEGSLLAIADCAVNAEPSESELADIAIASADTVHRLFGWEPRVAMLSFSTKGSAEHARVDRVRNAIAIAREKRPDLLIDGEFQLDAAIIPAVAARKVKDGSQVAGRANVIIFPDLDAGNIGVKLVQNFAKANAYGPMLQGFSKAIGDFSRSAPVDEMIGNIAMVAVSAE
jgi:phosphate acetyltransferase